MNKKKKFDLKIKKSLNYNDMLYTDDKRYPVYFGKKYVDEIKKYFKNNGITCYDKRELISVTNKNKDLIKMCSAASSARLAYFYFVEKNIIPEKECKNGLGSSPQLDGWDKNNNIYYECKCHEIFDVHSPLKIKYQDTLKLLFDLDDLDVVNEDEDEAFLDIKLSDFGYDDDISIYSLHLDVKQLICHLVGLKNDGGVNPTLQYIFFTPNEEDDVSVKYSVANIA